MSKPRSVTDSIILALAGCAFFVGVPHLAMTIFTDPVSETQVAGVLITLAVFTLLAPFGDALSDRFWARRGRGTLWSPGTPSRVVWADRGTKWFLVGTMSIGGSAVVQGGASIPFVDVLIASGWLIRVVFWHVTATYAAPDPTPATAAGSGEA